MLHCRIGVEHGIRTEGCQASSQHVNHFFGQRLGITRLSYVADLVQDTVARAKQIAAVCLFSSETAYGSFRRVWWSRVTYEYSVTYIQVVSLGANSRFKFRWASDIRGVSISYQ